MLNGISVIKEIPLKNWFLASCLSRSLKVIGNDTDRYAIDDFLLTFPINHEPILYRLRDKWRFQSKIAKIFPPPYGRLWCCDVQQTVMFCVRWLFYLLFTYEHWSLTLTGMGVGAFDLDSCKGYLVFLILSRKVYRSTAKYIECGELFGLFLFSIDDTFEFPHTHALHSWHNRPLSLSADIMQTWIDAQNPQNHAVRVYWYCINMIHRVVLCESWQNRPVCQVFSVHGSTHLSRRFYHRLTW